VIRGELVGPLTIVLIYSPARERWQIIAPDATSEQLASAAIALEDIAAQLGAEGPPEVDDAVLDRAIAAYHTLGKVDDEATFRDAMREALGAALEIDRG
jgi:hypothetical protein